MRPACRVERLADGKEVAPGKPLGNRVSQKIGRVQRGHRAHTSIVQPFAAQLHDALGGPGELLGRRVAEKNQKLRRQKLDLPLDERLANLDLLRRGRAVAGRAPEYEVGDVDVRLAKPDCGEHPVEKLPCPAHEWLALDVLVLAGRLADEHDARLRRATRQAEARRGLF